MNMEMAMSEQTGLQQARARWLVFLTYLLSIVNGALALNFFPLVPLMGWLNYGHGGTPWLPDLLLLTLLPAGYYLYWHFWYVVAIPALACSLVLRRHGPVQWPTVLNLATIILYWLVRLILFLAGIRPDSV